MTDDDRINTKLDELVAAISELRDVETKHRVVAQAIDRIRHLMPTSYDRLFAAIPPNIQFK